MKKRICKCGCEKSIEHKHPNAKFLNQKHKDRFHNSIKSSWIRKEDGDSFRICEVMELVEVGWDAHKDV